LAGGSEKLRQGGRTRNRKPFFGRQGRQRATGTRCQKPKNRQKKSRRPAGISYTTLSPDRRDNAVNFPNGHPKESVLAHNHSSAVRPGVEVLEDRLAPAGHISWNGALVTVDGTPRHDKLVISYHAGMVRVALSGGARQVRDIPSSQLREVLFFGCGGSDTLVNRTAVRSITYPGRQPPPVTADLAAAAQTLVTQTNAFRQSSGLPPLAVNGLLAKVAQAHAANMALQDKYGDTDTNGHILDGHDAVWRVAQVGYQPAVLLENVAVELGAPNPAQEFLKDWWNSLDHRLNILNPVVTEFGCGIAQGLSGRYYAVQVFALPLL
jgi:uncharacterized protein YkwD